MRVSPKHRSILQKLFSRYRGLPEPTGLFTIVHLVSFTAKIKSRLNFLAKVDSQFALSPHPNYPQIRVSRQRKLRINLG